MDRMNKYIILLLPLVLCACSGKLREEVNKPKKIKITNCTMSLTHYDINGYQDIDTMHKEIVVNRILNSDTITYIYNRDKNALADTLKIYKNIFLFNRERLETFSEKKMSFKGSEIIVYQFLYLDNRVLHSTCSVPFILYINDSLGIVMATRRRWHIDEYGTQVQELQKMIQKDSVFFR
jgi:predicted DNA-binding transcriptional regulator